MARNFPVTGHLLDMARSGHGHCGSWIRTSGSASSRLSRVAYATVGDGPPIVFGAKWVSHLEEEWDDPLARRFYEELARTHTVVRYDRLGAGLSDREPARARIGRPRHAGARGGHPRCGRRAGLDVRVLVLVGRDCAARRPSRRSSFERVVFFGSFVSREDLPEVTRRSLVDFVRVNWALAAQMLAGLIMPHASGDEIAALSRHKRRAADAETAAAFLELELFSNARPDLAGVTMPTLVLHRRGDRTVPISRGRELAALLPNARFVALAATRTSRTSTTSEKCSARSPASSTTRRRPTRTATRRCRGARRRCSARRRGSLEPGDRVVARPLRAHGAPPRREHPHQADAVFARRGRCARPARGLHLDASTAGRRGRPERRRDH